MSVLNRLYDFVNGTKADPEQVDGEFNNIINYINNNIITQQTIQIPTLQNSWVNYGSSWSTAGYYKDSLGYVHLVGVVKSGILGAVIFTLPVGYRPATDHCFYSWNGNTTNGQPIYVKSNGEVLVPTNAAFSNTFISLDIPPFRAEQ